MKIHDLKFSIPVAKPRNSQHGVLASKKNAAGPHKDKKKAAKLGDSKHKNRLYHGEKE